jgi:hypothetical protein
MRVTLAAVLVTTLILIGFIGAPIVPVLLGAVGALAWARWKPGGDRTGFAPRLRIVGLNRKDRGTP